MTSEPEVVRETLEGFNGAPYTITSPHPESHMASVNPRWFVSCLDGAYYNATAHAKSAWSDNEGKVWVDSAHFDAIDWVEETYGEKAAIKAMDIDYTNLSMEEVQERLKVFPSVYDRIETYKRVLNDASYRTGISLVMVAEGKPAAVWLLFRGQVRTDGPRELAMGLRKTIEVLKEVYDLTEREPAYRR